MKNKTYKLQKLENSRYSIFECDENGKCFNCKRIIETQMHEVYGGSNRQRSMKNGLCVHLCNRCHHNENLILELKKLCQLEYEKKYTRNDFIKLVGKNYL